MISVQKVSKSYGALKAVDDISFEIQKGEVVGFLGPNGAGKSTTMRMLVGYLPPSVGRIEINGVDVQRDPIGCQKKIGYLPESAALYDELPVLDFLKFVANLRGLSGVNFKQRLEAVASSCQLFDVLGQKISTLSKGFRQRVGLAQALIHDPDILILDEPTVGLDPNQIREIRDLIKKIGREKTILLSTHILPEVSAMCQRVLIIKKGKLVAQGAPQELAKPRESQSVYRLGLRADLETIKNRLALFPHFDELKVVKSQQGRHQVILRCHTTDDQSEELFDFAVKENWRLSQLVRESQTLEDVFTDLTKDKVSS